MNKRIEKISSYIDETDKIVDIGCDQALLSELLAKRRIYSIASDINNSIIKNAKKRFENSDLNKYIKFVVSDGLKNITDDVDTLVLSGMGTYTILNILNNSKKQYKKIITISNNKHDELRKLITNKGYKVDSEEIILDKGKFYNLILFVHGNKKYTEEELLIGVNHQNKELLEKKLFIDLNKYKKIYNLSKDKEILNKISIIEKKLKNH